MYMRHPIRGTGLQNLQPNVWRTARLGLLVLFAGNGCSTSYDEDHPIEAHLQGQSPTGSPYSLDKKNWQLIRLFKNDYPASIWVGISTQCPLGEGTSAVFEDISLTKQSISDFRLGI